MQTIDFVIIAVINLVVLSLVSWLIISQFQISKKETCDLLNNIKIILADLAKIAEVRETQQETIMGALSTFDGVNTACSETNRRVERVSINIDSNMEKLNRIFLSVDKHLAEFSEALSKKIPKPLEDDPFLGKDGLYSVNAIKEKAVKSDKEIAEEIVKGGELK